MKQTFPKGDRIPTDTAGVFEQLTTAQKTALVTSPSLPPGIGGLLLDIITEDSVELSCDITDHYTEKNFAIQDHIAFRPETVTLHGTVSELSILRTGGTGPDEARPSIPAVRDSLPANAQYSPRLTEGAVQRRKAAEVPAKPSTGVLAKYEDAYGVIGAQRGKKQKDVFAYFYQLCKGRQLVTVETAWGIWPFMAIQSVRAEQGPDSRHVSEFNVTFKPIRMASDLTVRTVKAAGITQEQKDAEAKLRKGNGGQAEAKEGTTLLRKALRSDD